MKYTIRNRAHFFYVVFVICALFSACSDEQKTIVTSEIEPPDPIQVDPNKVITINTNAIVGQMYNFWSTRPMVNQTRFNSANFTNSLDNIRPYVKSYNLVRLLGGRTDNLNTFYQGVDASGNIITDFSGLITSMNNFMLTGFKPRIVLDNVPWAMNAIQEVNLYGNTNPPDDYGLWRQYINAFLQTLIDEFGYDEVKTWRFRVATEPNFTPQHWNGTPEDFFRHYDITVDEVLQLIPDAIIGPGNLLTESSAATFATELIDHCATGTNYATGETGTKMDFFGISYYERIARNTIDLPQKIEPYRASLDSYPQFMNIPLDIQEFGIIKDEYGNRGTGLQDATEFGASWYARIADLAYQYRINEIYDWGQEIQATDLPSGRRHVTDMFLMMEGGNRVESFHNLSGHVGIIPVVKNDRIYLLVYNHNTTRNSGNSRVVFPIIEGGQVSSAESWTMNEWSIDKTHGIFMHQLYEDVRAAGVVEYPDGRIYGNRPSDRFEEGWKTILNANLSLYEDLAELPQTSSNRIVQKKDETITLEVNLEPHSVKLIELIPQ